MHRVNNISNYQKGLKAAIFLMISVLYTDVAAQELTPQQYFGDSYTEAISYFQTNKLTFELLLSKYHVSTHEAIAIVFPEIIRYNRFRDFVETSALELAYAQGGLAIADFSIGHFQMKPSFVEMLEQELIPKTELFKQFEAIATYSPNLSINDIRSQRIERLKLENWQLQYLACFIRLAEIRFDKELIEKPLERLLILSSAYNRGLNSNYDELKLLSEKKSFPYGPTINGRFSYYDVANYFYSHYAYKP